MENDSSAQLAKISKDSSRTVKITISFLCMFVIILLVAGGLLVISDINGVKKNQRSDCQFYLLILNLPVITSGATKTSELGVKLVNDSRIAYEGKSCGKLPPPSAALTELGKVYRIYIAR